VRSELNHVPKSPCLPFGAVSLVLFVVAVGLWLYTGAEPFLFGAAPAAIFVVVAIMAGILTLLERISLKWKP
jgi:hypothetical protein